MSNATPTNFGQTNGSGDRLNLFLKVFGGEVITAFQRKTVMNDKVMLRNIASGKSAQFPVLGRTTASYHTPGAEILGQNDIRSAEVVINIGGFLVTSQFVAEIDEIISHFDVRGPYAEQMGEALAIQMDTDLLKQTIKGARSANVNTQLPGGTQIGTNGLSGTGINYATNGDHLAEAIFLAAQALDEKNVPQSDRYAVVRPAQYYNLVKATKNINKDWNGAGSFADGTVVKIAGIPIFMSNNLPSTDLSAATGAAAGWNNSLQGDYSDTTAVVFHKSATGLLKAKDLAVETTWDPRRLGTLMTARYAIGHGSLRPDACVEIVNATV